MKKYRSDGSKEDLNTMTTNTDLSRISSTFDLPRPSSASSSSSTSHLAEYTHVPDDAKIPATHIPVVNPYKIFHKQSFSPTRSLRRIIRSTPSPPIKEIVQSSSMGSCLIPSEQKEHYIDLQISPDLIAEWLAEGYTHLHFGAIRIVLSSHGRHGLPTAVKLALLNSTFLQYEHAIIGTVLSTLNAGSIVLTFYPNFNVPLKDPNLPSLLQIQIQMTGAEQIPTAYAGTMHHQMVYRLQDHALNLPQNGFSGEPLLITAERQDIPTITQIPKQMAKEELQKLIPLQWFTNYEKLRKTSKPLVAMDPTFQSMPDGTVKTSFLEPQPHEETPQAFQTMMITPHHPDPSIPVHTFYPDGSHAYTAKIDGHFIWDVDPSMCDPGCDCHLHDDSDDDYCTSRRSQRKKKNSSPCQPQPRRRQYHPDDPDSP